MTIRDNSSNSTSQWFTPLSQHKTLLIASVALLLACAFVLLFYIAKDVNSTLFAEKQTAVNGKLDLSSVNMAESDPVLLVGEWQFYWKQFVLSDNFETDIDAPNDLIVAPSFWQNQVHLGDQITPRGFATYRLRVKLQATESLLSLSMPVMGTAYRLYVNQELVDEVGKIAINEQHSEPNYSPKIVTIRAPEGQLDIILQVSNYDLAWGGLWFPIKLASADKQFQAELRKSIRTVSIAAIFFTIAVLSLFHFALRPTDSLPFLLALSCLCLGMREVETSHILYFADAISFSFDTVIRINFLTFYMAILFITAYFHFSYPNEFGRKSTLFISVISCLFSISTFVASPNVFSEFMRYFQFFSLGVLVWGFYSILLAARRGRMGAKLLAVGAAILFALTLNDILFSLTIVNTGNMAGLGLLCFILCQNYLTYVRFINDSREMKVLSIQANQDPLTLLLNRRGLLDAISHTIAEQREESTHFSVMIIDFDHFKKLNDSLGHDIGDRVLVKGSKIMQSVVRKQDLVARWGGEEFVIFLPNTDKEGAEILAEKLRVRLSKDVSDDLHHAFTSSLGVAQSEEGESFSRCLKRADIALYSAKKSGRNCVVLAS